ncbi:rRNA methyltransferase [Frankia sp. CcI49]|uniref:TrmH family RNA methyltransferase n=1 Tax=Frankia sp. CcI49 TaxID=1745382 RepID=UPI00097787C0|nr:RNA methyltransferase [Frankia sp. CcI49]ONH57053.1 rRNA methyltransferase [Frankia sp. CcI49]
MTAEGDGPVVVIDDPADPRVSDYVALTDVALRRRREPEQGLFIAEGERVIERALRAGYQPRSVLVSPARRHGVPAGFWARPSPGQPAAPVYVAGPAVLAAITGFEVHRGALASMCRREPLDAARLLATARRVLVCEDLVSHTNLGAIFRSAAGLGMDAVLLSPRCADPLYRRSVRVSMGEVFAVPYARLEPWPAALSLLRMSGFEVVALTPAADAQELTAAWAAPDDRVAVLLGTEGSGLTDEVLATATRRARIPMAHGVDSLNVAATAAIACYVLGLRPPAPSVPSAPSALAGPAR